ncbi:MAG: oxaloacetate decarboxylase [Clostridiales bacterium]|nr:oxaloacetate decarboxylase [Clostridiales bacterium]
MGKGNIFRKILSENDYLVLPGAYDCLSAQIIESLGFKGMDITGLGIEYSRLGQPDLGLSTLTEVADQCGNIAGSVDIPVIADADTGYGGILNVARTAHVLEKAGLAGMHMEDQTMPKKCGNLAGKELITKEEMCAKIRAAKDAVEDFFIIARCDGRRFGRDEVKRRLHAYLDAGADMAMLGDDYPVEELREMAGEFSGNLYLVVAVYPGEEMCLPAAEYASMGVKCISYPIVGLNAAALAIKSAYEHLREKGGISEDELASRTLHIRDMEELVHMGRWQAIEEKFGRF